MVSEDWLRPDWPAVAKVQALVTTRRGGFSSGDFASFNLALHVGDDARHVELNRARLQTEIGTEYPLHWIRQVHGTRVWKLDRDAVSTSLPEADAIYTREPGQACAILTADCLPVFFCSRDGREIALAHAGWRGLAGGILEATLACFQNAPDAILAWFGPAIGPAHFEVGAEVRERFMMASSTGLQQQLAPAFTRSARHADKWRADLYRLARVRLRAAGLEDIYGGELCTFSDNDNFYSYRRQPRTGRMASVIYKTA
ncbi:MAG: peptidoglycan editing factor PgeF [Pseudomonadales bacterium]|nr:peptidoglycan editing factor PgeF [Pseudomonadales bacterium]